MVSSMCMGLALGFNWDKGVICTGSSSHIETLGNLEDSSLKLELIIDYDSVDKYTLKLDSQYYYKGKVDIKIIEKFSDMLTKSGKIRKPVLDIINTWIKENELRVVKWLLVCQVNTVSKKSIYQSYAKSGEDIDQSYAKAGQDIDQKYAEASRGIYQRYAEAGRDIDQSYAKAGRDIDQKYAEVGQDIDQRYAEAGEDIDQRYAKAGRDIYRYSVRAGQDIYQRSAEAGRDIDIGFSKSGLKDNRHDKENQFIEELSNINGKLTLAQLAKVAMFASEEQINSVMREVK